MQIIDSGGSISVAVPVTAAALKNENAPYDDYTGYVFLPDTSGEKHMS